MRTLILALMCTLAVALPPLAQADHTKTHITSHEQLQQLRGSLKALRSALTRIGKEKQRLNYTQPLTNKATRLEQDAVKLIGKHQHNKAHQQLKLAMDVVKTGIATLRNQETLIRSLDFTSPLDEFRYEQQRFVHYCQLVDLLIKNRGHADAINLRQQAQIIADAAAQQANSKKFNQAIKTQEQSNRLMLKAIRSSGVDLSTS